MTTENLLDRLLPSDLEVDHYEVLAVLERHLGPAGHRGRGRLVYPDREDYALLVRWENGCISRIEGGPAFDLLELDSLKARVREELSESVLFVEFSESTGVPLPRIERAILFSSPQKITG